MKDIQKILKKYQRGEPLTPEEKRWLDSFYLHYAKRSKYAITDDELGKNLSKVEAQVKKSIIYSRFGKKVRFAVAAAILAGVFWFGYYHIMSNTNELIEIQIAAGEMREITLDDGSVVTLNGSSKLIYPTSFNQVATREVTVVGEAYFDVAKNKRKPFLIHTPRMEIRVLGTAFNVRDYAEDAQAETALIHGKVEVWKSGQKKDIYILKPKEKFVLKNASVVDSKSESQTNTGKLISHSGVDIHPIAISEKDGYSIETEWMVKRVTVRDESLWQIARRLERIYGVKISILDQSIGNQMYSATFDKDSMDNILHGLQVVSPFRYRKDNLGNVEIYGITDK